MKTNHSFLDKQRHVGDPKADTLVHHFFERNEQALLYLHLRINLKEVIRENHPDLKNFLCTSRPAPRWSDPDRVIRGQRVFEKYALPIMTLLGGLSLPYCFAASPGNKALYFAEKMRQSPGKRLADTADFILAVCTPGSLEKKQPGFFSINKTRLIHAIARYHILSKGIWDDQWGKPINQEDMAGTNLAFSFIILLGLQKSAIVLSVKEKEDFLFLWRFIAYQLYISNDLLPHTFTESAELDRQIRNRHFKKSTEGVMLTKELLEYYKGVVPKLDGYLLDSQIRYWLGKKVADCLGLSAQPFKDNLVESINSFRELGNLFRVNTNTYTQMMARHQKLKALSSH